MDFELTEDQETIRKAVAGLLRDFDDRYWMEKDRDHEFPAEFYDVVARGGWLAGAHHPRGARRPRARHHRGHAASGAMRIAPISQEMILSYLGSHVLGLPRSY
ncbi:hypothetical protein [Streptomyces sp. NBC_00576]|uniref:hypothetical protein n=1 Tax=Streptomyces sp. NBC_00576 TaxID=2903665 RepID=UPI002E80776C|nr:hypothetical protein [Streptomyces sp. NBC_00576]WUB76704.1 hypothetical protein OG734_45415 [Streptomyces sp. NBC_00576]